MCGIVGITSSKEVTPRIISSLKKLEYRGYDSAGLATLSMKNKFGFVLVKPQLGENIGAVARSLKNFGFRKLNLVTPKFTFPNQKTKVTSVGAFDLINSTKVFDNIEQA